MVGARRFELPTPPTPRVCATRLRHAPTSIVHYSDRAVNFNVFLTVVERKPLFLLWEIR